MKKEAKGRIPQQILLKDDEAVVQAVKEYLPNFPLSIVRKSYHIWHLFDKHHKAKL